MSGPVSRVVVITGGSRGIGRSIALKFSEENPKIIIIHLDPDGVDSENTLHELSLRGIEAVSHRIDVSSFEAMDTLFGDIISRFKKIDVLINNAGITRDKLFIRMSEEDWDRVLRVNLQGVFNCTRAAVRSMIRQKKGHIVNISSVVGQIGNIGQANYCASKAGIMGFTKSIAREVAGRGINVNAVAPGFIDTGMTAVLPERVKHIFLQQIPLGKFGRPEDIAETVYWLCSDAAAYITGQVIHVNGGLYM
ncbi:MAG TPA: 3-oxoacyl-[acyl-carrier-protein] reductase [Desulfobacteraceae bacterium]|nr:3-oxoacyl-[acyl-carrier-protein] reductase [Desulfobacteraceae bacterium]